MIKLENHRESKKKAKSLADCNNANSGATRTMQTIQKLRLFCKRNVNPKVRRTYSISSDGFHVVTEPNKKPSHSQYEKDQSGKYINNIYTFLPNNYILITNNN